MANKKGQAILRWREAVDRLSKSAAAMTVDADRRNVINALNDLSRVQELTPELIDTCELHRLDDDSDEDISDEVK